MIYNPNYKGIRDITNERDWPYGKEVPHGRRQPVSQTPVCSEADDSSSRHISAWDVENDRAGD